MALKNLIINNTEVTEDLLDKVLTGNVNLVKQGNSVVLTQQSNKLPNRERILLYLCGKEAWKLLEKNEILVSLFELEKNLGIKGNTLRPILKSLKDEYKVESQKGKYFILPQGIFSLQAYFENPNSESNSPKSVKKNNKPRKSSVTDFLLKLNEEGFFNTGKNGTEIYKKLIEKGVTSLKLSSLPSYLLPLVRNDILSRKKIDTEAGMGKIWVYSKK
ncbi:MAG: hypothetical protein WCW25_02350 [Patescibacteria group bacterium]|jgi:hypothetical protein